MHSQEVADTATSGTGTSVASRRTFGLEAGTKVSAATLAFASGLPLGWHILRR